MSDENLLINFQGEASALLTVIKQIKASLNDLNTDLKVTSDAFTKAGKTGDVFNTHINTSTKNINNLNTSIDNSKNTLNQMNNTLNQSNKIVNDNSQNLKQNIKNIQDQSQNLQLNNKNIQNNNLKIQENTKIINDNSTTINENTKIIIKNYESTRITSNAYSGLSNTVGSLISAYYSLHAVMGAMVANNAFIEYGREVEVNFRNMNSISLLTDENFEKITDTVTKMTSAQGLNSLKNMSNTLYEVYSAGYKSSEALKIVEESNLTAGAGLAKTDDVLKATISTLHSYGYGINEVGRIQNLFIKGVQDGVYRLDEFSRYIGQAVTLAPEFKKANGEIALGIEQITAALVGTTRQGLNLAESTTAVNQLLKSFMDPAKESAELAQQLGINMSSSAFQTKNLGEVIQDVLRKTEGANQQDILGKLFGNVRAVKAFFKLAKDDATFFQKELDALLNDTTARDKALEQQRMSFDQHLQALSTRWEVVMQDFFKISKDFALPIVEIINNIVETFNNLPEGSRKAIAIVGVLGTAFLGLVATGVTVALSLGAVSTALTFTATSLGATTAGVLTLNTALLTLLLTVGVVGGAVTGAVAIFYGLHKASEAWLELMGSPEAKAYGNGEWYSGWIEEKMNEPILRQIDLWQKVKDAFQAYQAEAQAQKDTERNDDIRDNAKTRVQELTRLKNSGQALSSSELTELARNYKILETFAHQGNKQYLSDLSKMYRDEIQLKKEAEDKKAKITLEGLEKQKEAIKKYDQENQNITDYIEKLGKSDYQKKVIDLTQNVNSRKEVLQNKIVNDIDYRLSNPNTTKEQKEELIKQRKEINAQILILEKSFINEKALLDQEEKKRIQDNAEKIKNELQRISKERFQNEVDSKKKELEAIKAENVPYDADVEKFEAKRTQRIVNKLNQIKSLYLSFSKNISLMSELNKNPELTQQAKADPNVYNAVKNSKVFDTEDINKFLNASKGINTQINKEITESKIESSNRQIQAEKTKHEAEMKSIESLKKLKQLTQEEAITQESEELQRHRDKLNQLVGLSLKGTKQRIAIDNEYNQTKEKQALNNIQIDEILFKKAIDSTKITNAINEKTHQRKIENIQDEITSLNNQFNIRKISEDKYYSETISNLKAIKAEKDRMSEKTKFTDPVSSKKFERESIDTQNKIDNVAEARTQKNIQREFVEFNTKKTNIEREKQLNLISDEEVFDKEQDLLDEIAKKNFTLSEFYKNDIDKSANYKLAAEDAVFQIKLNHLNQERKLLIQQYNIPADVLQSISNSLAKSNNGGVQNLGKAISGISNNLKEIPSTMADVTKAMAGDPMAMTALVSKGIGEVVDTVVGFSNAWEKMNKSIKGGSENTQEFIESQHDMIRAIPFVGEILSDLGRSFTDFLGVTISEAEKTSRKNTENNYVSMLKNITGSLYQSKEIKLAFLKAEEEAEKQKAQTEIKVDTEKQSKLLEISSRYIKLRSDLNRDYQQKDIELNKVKAELQKDELKRIDEIYQADKKRIEIELNSSEYKSSLLADLDEKNRLDKEKYFYEIQKMEAEAIEDEKTRIDELYKIEKRHIEATIGDEKRRNATLVKLTKEYEDNKKKLIEKSIEDQKKLIKEIEDIQIESEKKRYESAKESIEKEVDTLKDSIDQKKKILEKYKKDFETFKETNINKESEKEFQLRTSQTRQELARTNFFDYSTGAFDDEMARKVEEINANKRKGLIDEVEKMKQLQEIAIKTNIYYDYRANNAVKNSKLEGEYRQKSNKAGEDYLSLFIKLTEEGVKKEVDKQEESIKSLEDLKKSREQTIKDIEDQEKKAIDEIKQAYQDQGTALRKALLAANTAWDQDSKTKIADLVNKLNELENQKKRIEATNSPVQQNSTSLITPDRTGITGTTSTASTTPVNNTVVSNPYSTVAPSTGTNISNPYSTNTSTTTNTNDYKNLDEITKKANLVRALYKNSPTYSEQYFFDTYFDTPLPTLIDIVKQRNASQYVPGIEYYENGGVISKRTDAVMGERGVELVANMDHINNANLLLDRLENPNKYFNTTTNRSIQINFTGPLYASSVSQVNEIGKQLLNQIEGSL